jgi:uroporphyrinogen decarboxylase
MTHRERIEALLNGEKPDRMPVSFWRHFYESESTAEQLADAMVGFQKKFDWDLMKINSRASYYVEDWGGEYEYTGIEHDHPTRLDYALKSPADWQKIVRLDPRQARVLSEHIKAVGLIKKRSPETLPIVMTIFNPLSVAGDLVDNDAFMVDQIRSNPEALHEALENITGTYIDLAKEYIRAGADGIFYATTEWASTDLITEDEYLKFGHKYDMIFLEEIVPLTKFNVMHVCAGNNMLALFADYPIKIVSWDMTDPTNPDAERGAEILRDKVLMGGVDKDNLLQTGTKAELEAMVEKYHRFAGKHPFILGPNCSVPSVTPDENLAVIKSKIEQLTL